MRVKMKGTAQMSVSRTEGSNGVKLPPQPIDVESATLDGKHFTVGTPVRWQYVESGRDGLEWDVTATIVRLGKKRIRIRVKASDGSPVERWAQPKHLTPIKG